MLKPIATALGAVLVLHGPALAEVPKQVLSIRTEAGNIKVSEVTDGLVHPWGIDSLPDGRMLVTERPGRLRLVTAEGKLQSEPVAGTPEVWAQGQGGMLDVAVDPKFDENQLVWLTYAEAGEGGKAGTALGRGRLVDDRLEGFEVVWRQTHKVAGPNHFGSRIVFAPGEDGDEIIYVALGDRFKFEPAQDLSNTLGTVIRINREGEAVDSNPFIDQPDAEGEIYSYGHRNIQAAAFDPASGNVFVAEMGPLGGDELNRLQKGANYGWPVVSWGTDYDGADIPDPPARPEFQRSLTYWTPVLAPSGMTFYEGKAFGPFKGDALIGGLVSEGITRVVIEDGQVSKQEHIPLARRVRDVHEGPDGLIYVLIDQLDGFVWKLEPLSRTN